MTKKYFVYDDNNMLSQYDERYIETRENENAELVPEEFDNLEDAKAFLNEVVSDWPSTHEVIHTKHGLDTVVFHVAWIEEETYDEVERVVSLPDSVREAAHKHESEYWKYLDYEEDGYSPLNDDAR